MRVITVIEARMNSTRLPGKPLLELAGKTVLERAIARHQLAQQSEHIVVATTTNPKDDALVECCRKMGIDVFRGSESDVLGRVYNAARPYHPQVVVQAGSDNPFYDPALEDLLVSNLTFGGYAYAANDMELTFPNGIEAHVMQFEALQYAAAEAKSPQEREDTPRFLWNHPNRFPIFNLRAVPGSFMHRPNLRLTLDYPEDLELCRKLYKALGNKSDFTTHQVLTLLDSHPEWAQINAACEQVSAAYVS